MPVRTGVKRFREKRLDLGWSCANPRLRRDMEAVRNELPQATFL
jgi:hypothetical protein